MPDLREYTNLVYQGSMQAGGWTATLEVTDPSEIVRFSALDAYATEYWTGALTADAERLDFSGHILPQSWQADYQTNPLQVLATTSQVILQNLEVQAIGWAERPAPVNNHQLVSLTLGAMAEHILDSHCNLVYDAVTNPNGWITLDFLDDTAGDTFDVFVTERAGIWGVLQELAQHAQFAVFLDKRDRLYFDWHPMFAPPASVVTFNEELWYNIVVSPRDRDVNQVVVTGRRDDGTDITSAYPITKALYGKEEQRSVRANSQANLNTITQNRYRYLTREHDLQIETWVTNLDLGDRVGVTYANAELDINWSDEDFYIESMRIQPDLQRGGRVTILKLVQGN